MQAAAAASTLPIPPGEWDVEVAILGGGPGGEDCARLLAERGVRVAMIDDAPLPGGECLWRGCIPSKAWRHAADLIRDRARDADKGVAGTQRPRLDWATLEAHRKNVLRSRGELALKTDQSIKIDVRRGFASFLDAHHLKIVAPGGAESTLTFGAAVIATGAPPYVPPIPGARESLRSGGVLTSDTIWNLPGPPRRLGIIGGGAIGVEMAQIVRDFGGEVLILEAGDRILAGLEEEIARHLSEMLTREFPIVTGARIEGITGQADSMRIQYRDAAGRPGEFLGDYVLLATGKRPNTAMLNLEAAGVELAGAAIKTDAQCRTSIPHIFAVGDVSGGHMLAHTAAAQGRVAARTLLGEPAAYREELDCGVVFSRPQAGFVGLTLAQARARGLDAVEAKMPMSIDAKAMIALETHGMLKLVAEKTDGCILGVHFLAEHTDTLIGAAVMMVSGRLSLGQVAEAIFPHPTQTELFGDLARRLLARLRRSARPG